MPKIVTYDTIDLRQIRIGMEDIEVNFAIVDSTTKERKPDVINVKITNLPKNIRDAITLIKTKVIANAKAKHGI